MFEEISIIVLAAGASQRMGRPKLLLPWGETTVLGKVVATFASGFASAQVMSSGENIGEWEIVVVTGGARRLIEALVSKLVDEFPVRAVFNPDYAKGGMLTSIQVGLRSLRSNSVAALIGLGDQPQMQVETLYHIYSAYSTSKLPLIIPSYRNRRGHPWLVKSTLWPELLDLPDSITPREFLGVHKDDVEYVLANESILQDLDTPEEYDQARPAVP
jgi:molybdenum cofactor cytidylyltransferase